MLWFFSVDVVNRRIDTDTLTPLRDSHIKHFIVKGLGTLRRRNYETYEAAHRNPETSASPKTSER